MPESTPVQRLKSSRIVQALVLYLGAGWVVLQVVDTLADALPMPEWLVPATLALLLVGLAIVLATSWVQSRPETTAAEEAGAVPTDWQVAPRDLMASLKAGRLPHLTWGRTILGGFVAFWFLFGLAGIYAVFTGRSVSLLPAAAGADESASGVAVVPFEVNGPDLEVYREGMADLFTTNLDGVGGIRTIPSRTVLSRWRRDFGDDERPELEQALEVAGSTGARFALVGSAVAVGSDVRLAAEIYDLASGADLGGARVEGAAGSVLSLVNRLSVELAGVLLSESGGAVVSPSRVASITTESLPALQAYLEGEAAYRRSDLPTAVEAYRSAVAEDSLFALARWRLATASSWTRGYDYWAIDTEQLGIAAAQADRLPARDADLLRAFQAFEAGDAEALSLARELTQSYPDDPDAWLTLGEVFVHDRNAVLEDRAEGVEALRRAVELDPTFAPYRVHLIEYAIAEDDTAGGFAHLEEYERLAGPGALPYLRMGTELYLGSAEQRAAALALADSVPPPVIGALLSQLDWTSDDVVAQTELMARFAARASGMSGAPPAGVIDAALASFLMAEGRAGEAVKRLAAEGVPPDQRAIEAWVFARILRPLTGEQRAWLDPNSCEGSNTGGACEIAVAAAAAEGDDWATFDRVVARGRAMVDEIRADGDDGTADRREAYATALEGYAAAQQGRVDEGIQAMRSGQGQKFGPDHWVRLWIGEAYVEAGQPELAVPYFRSMWLNRFKAYGAYRLGGIYEDLGQTDLARQEYTRFLRMWANADADLPQLAEARAALERLGG
jgi:tetratricopeptide (TPR) repeat protein